MNEKHCEMVGTKLAEIAEQRRNCAHCKQLIYESTIHGKQYFIHVYTGSSYCDSVRNKGPRAEPIETSNSDVQR